MAYGSASLSGVAEMAFFIFPIPHDMLDQVWWCLPPFQRANDRASLDPVERFNYVKFHKVNILVGKAACSAHCFGLKLA